jgi:hypothetical protein
MPVLKSRMKTQIGWCIACVLVIACIFFQHVAYQNRDRGTLRGDTSNLACFIAANENPQSFQHDMMLSDHQHWGFYPTPLLYIVEKLNHWINDYRDVFKIINYCFIPVYLLGIYGLIYLISGSIAISLFSMIYCLGAVNMSHGGNWQMPDYISFTPKYMFQAILPWVLQVVYLTKGKEKSWYISAILLGLLIYIHPASAPAWGICIWGGWIWLTLTTKNNREKKTRIVCLAIASIAALVVITPFFSVYLATTTPLKGIPADIDHNDIYQIALGRFGLGYLHFPTAIAMLVLSIIDQWTIAACLFCWSALSVVVSLGSKSFKDDMPWWLVCGGIYFGFTVLVPAIDQGVCYYLKRMPLEIDLIRNLRYWPFWCILLGAAGFRAIYSKTKQISNRRTVCITSALVFGFLMIASFAFVPEPFKHFKYSPSLMGILISITPDWQKMYRMQDKVEVDEIVAACKEFIPKDASVMGPMFVRYLALRSLCYSFKDGGIFYNSNWNRLMEWRDKSMLLAELSQKSISFDKRLLSFGFGVEEHTVSWIKARQRLVPPQLRGDEPREVFDDLGAQYLILRNIDTDKITIKDHKVLFEGKKYCIIQLI